jgi:hypothetical protein
VDDRAIGPDLGLVEELQRVVDGRGVIVDLRAAHDASVQERALRERTLEDVPGVGGHDERGLLVARESRARRRAEVGDLGRRAERHVVGARRARVAAVARLTVDFGRRVGRGVAGRDVRAGIGRARAAVGRALFAAAKSRASREREHAATNCVANERHRLRS